MDWFIKILITLAMIAIASYISRVKPERPTAPTIDELDVPQAKEGKPLGKLFGTILVKSANVPWYGDLNTTALTTKGARAYGFFGPRPTITTGFEYRIGFHFVPCLGPIDSLRQIYIDERLAVDFGSGLTSSGSFQIDLPNLFGPSDREGGVVGTGDFYKGQVSQTAAEFNYLNTKTSPPHPAYRGVASIVMRQTYIGNTPVLRPWAFRVQRIDSLETGGTQWNPSIAKIPRPGTNFFDMNPVHILRELLISPDVAGAVLPSELGSSWTPAAQTLFDENFGLSFLWDTNISRGDFKSEIEKHIDGRVYADRATGKWEIKLIRKDYDINQLFVCDDTNVVDWSNINLPQKSGLVNSVSVVYFDPVTEEDVSLTVSDPAKVRENEGAVVQEKIVYKGVHNNDLAIKLAQRDLAVQSSGLINGEIVLAFLPFNSNVGDAIVLNAPRLGLNNMVARIGEIEEGFFDESKVTVRFIQDAFDELSDPFYVVTSPTIPPPPNPVAITRFRIEEAALGLLYAKFGEIAINNALESNPTAGFASLAIEQANSAQLEFLYNSSLSPSVIPEEQLSYPFTNFGTLISQLEERPDHNRMVIVPNQTSLDGKLILLNGKEFCRVTSIVQVGVAGTPENYWWPAPWLETSGAITVDVERGLFDTSPAFHFSESQVVIYKDFLVVDDGANVAGDELNVWAQNISAAGIFPISQSFLGSINFIGRANFPSPPGNVRVDGNYAPPEWEFNTTYNLTWTHRNRFDQSLKHIDQGPSSPEAGVTYRVLIRQMDFDGTTKEVLVDTNVGTATSYSYTTPAPNLVGTGTSGGPEPDNYPVGAGVLAQVISVRNGLESLFNRNLIFPVENDCEDLDAIIADSNETSSIFQDAAATIPAANDEKVGAILSACTIAPPPPGPGLYEFESFTFTSGTAEGRVGPSLGNLLAAYDTQANPWLDDPNFFNAVDGIQYWTVPATGTYEIEAWGSEGGKNNASNATPSDPGKGARMKGDFNLVEGEIIKILVGQKSPTYVEACSGAGGGGGTFVVREPYDTNQAILIIAGGGGGNASNSVSADRFGVDGTTSLSGTASRFGDTSGGVDGNGGARPPPICTQEWVPGSGGGFFTSGGGPLGFTGDDTTGGGFSFIEGGEGGDRTTGTIAPDRGSSGGFGGGGRGMLGGGGGGGYSGGGGGTGTACTCSSFRGGGGGGSFNSGANQDNAGGVRSGQGQVIITKLN